MNWRQWLPTRSAPLPIVLAIALGGPLAASGVRWAMMPVLNFDLPFITYFPFLLGAAIWGGIGAGAGALAISALVGALLFLPPDMGASRAAWSCGAFVVSGGLLAVVGAALSASLRALDAGERRLLKVDAELRTLVTELSHRSKNGLTVVSAIVAQSAKGAASVQDLEALIGGRLDALARAQDEIVHAKGGAVQIESLLRRTLYPFGLERFDFPTAALPIRIVRETAGGLSLLVHELATNAVKYGALSVDSGKVAIRWEATESHAAVTWVEHGGPPVGAVATKGFGTRLLASALAAQGGAATRRFEPTGVVCEVRVPVATGAA